MRISITLLATLIIFSISSCQKETDFSSITPIVSTPGTPTASRVKTYTEDIKSPSFGNSTTTYNLTYDATGRQTSMISTSNPGDKFLYQYNTNNSLTLELFNSNVLSIHSNIFLNSSSLIDSVFQYNDTQDTSTEKYLYNSSKQLVKMNEYDYSTRTGATLWQSTDYTYDTNGNLIKEMNPTNTITYDYTTLLNTLDVGVNYYYRNKNLTKTTTYNVSGTTITFNHTYTFDSSNRLTTEKLTGSEGTIATRTYTY